MTVDPKVPAIRSIFDAEDRKVLVLAMAALIDNTKLTPAEKQRADNIRSLCLDAIEAGGPLIEAPLSPAKIW